MPCRGKNVLIVPFRSKEKNLSSVRDYTELQYVRATDIFYTGEGFGLDEVRNCINIVHTIRNAEPIGLKRRLSSAGKISFGKTSFGWDR